MSEAWSDFPSSAKIVNAGWDLVRNVIVFVIEDPSFDEVDEGMIPPDLDVVFKGRDSELAGVLALVRPERT